MTTDPTQALLPVTAEDRKLWSAAFEAWNAGRNGFNPGGDHEAAAAILARHRVSHSLPRDTRIAVENIVTTMESNSFLIVREFAAHLRTALASLSTPTAEPMGPYASDRDLIEAAVQASLDAGLAENGVHGVAAARHAARFVVESREYWRNIERANLAAEVRQIKEAKQAPAIPADIGMNLAAAFGPILKEAFPEHSAQHRHAACDALAEAVVARAGWFAALTTPPTPDRIGKDAVREAVISDIATERQRQVDKEGWTPEHDDEHADGSLAAAAATYAFSAATADRFLAHDPIGFWPWDAQWWKPSTPRRDLIKAGALIIAEIERIDRATALPQMIVRNPGAKPTPLDDAALSATPAQEGEGDD